MAQLAGKSVIVTGASRGIGAATAEALASEGAALLLLARSADRITALATRLRKSGVQAEAMTCDVAEFTQVQAAVAAPMPRLAPVTITDFPASWAIGVSLPGIRLFSQ